MPKNQTAAGVKLDSTPLFAFLSEYESVCRKYGMIASAYGSEIYAYAVFCASPDEVAEHISDLKDEPLYKRERGALVPIANAAGQTPATEGSR